MRKMVIAFCAGMMCAAVPATAQVSGWDAGRFWRGAPEGPRERIDFLQQRIDRGIADGSLDRIEGRRVSRELDGIRRMTRSFHMRDGGRLTPEHRALVQSRLDDLSRQIRWARRNNW